MSGSRPLAALALALALSAPTLSCDASGDGAAVSGTSRDFVVDCVGMAPNGLGDLSDPDLLDHFFVTSALVSYGGSGGGARCVALLPLARIADQWESGGPLSIPVKGTWDLLDDPARGTLQIQHAGKGWTGSGGTITLTEIEKGRASGTYDMTVWDVSDTSQTARATGRFEYCNFSLRTDCPTRPTASSLDNEVTVEGPMVSGTGYALDCRALHDKSNGALVVDMELGIWGSRRLSDFWLQECNVFQDNLGEFRPRATFQLKAGGFAGPGSYGPLSPVPSGEGSAALLLPAVKWRYPYNFTLRNGSPNPCAAVFDHIDVEADADSACSYSLSEDGDFTLDCQDVTAEADRLLPVWESKGDLSISMRCDYRVLDATARPIYGPPIEGTFVAGETLRVDLDAHFSNPPESDAGQIYYEWTLEGSYPWGSLGEETGVYETGQGTPTARANIVEIPIEPLDTEVLCGNVGRLTLSVRAKNDEASRDIEVELVVLPEIGGEATSDVVELAGPLLLAPGEHMLLPVWTDGAPYGNTPEWRASCSDGSECATISGGPAENPVTLTIAGGATPGTQIAVEAGYCHGSGWEFEPVATVQVIAAQGPPLMPGFAPMEVYAQTTGCAPVDIGDVVGDSRPDALLLCPGVFKVMEGIPGGFGPPVDWVRRMSGTDAATLLPDPAGGMGIFISLTSTAGANQRPYFVPHQASPDPDLDGDGVPNADDGCIHVADPAQADSDGDGLTDACDPPAGGVRLFQPAPIDVGPGRVAVRAFTDGGSSHGYALLQLPSATQTLVDIPDQGLQLFGDFGDDGLLDVFYDQGWLIESGGALTQVLEPRPLSGPSVGSYASVRQGDFDGDGLTDHYNVGVVARWSPAGGFDRQSIVPTCCSKDGLFEILVVDDLTGDGRDDLLGECFDTHQICLQAGTEGGSLTAPATLEDPFADAATNVLLRYLDLDGDGVRDLVGLGRGGDYQVYLARGL